MAGGGAVKMEKGWGASVPSVLSDFAPGQSGGPLSPPQPGPPPRPSLSRQTQATCPAGCSPCTRCHQAFPLKTPLPGTSLPVLASELPLVHPSGQLGS